MKFLLLFLGISFFFIFFLLSQILNSGESFFGSLFLEANLYIAIPLLLIILLFKSELTKNKEPVKQESDTKIQKISQQDFIAGIKIFFTTYIYYIASILFYSSLFIIFQAILGEIHIPRIFLFFNILVLALYFLEHKVKIFQDFIRVNTFVISLYYIGVHILYLFGVVEGFSMEDIINIALIFLLFYLLFKSPRLKKYTPVLLSYIISFLFLECGVLIKYAGGDTLLLTTHIAFMSSLLFLLQTDFLAKLGQIKKSFVRAWGLIFSYAFIILTSLQISNISLESFIFGAELIIAGYILYLFHSRFQNYLSLFFASVSIILVEYFIYSLIVPLNSLGYYLSMFLFVSGAGYIAFDLTHKGKYIYDTYFFHIFSILVNLCGVISFFLFWDISILKIGILLLGESLYFFFSYYTLRKISQIG